MDVLKDSENGDNGKSTEWLQASVPLWNDRKTKSMKRKKKEMVVLYSNTGTHETLNKITLQWEQFQLQWKVKKTLKNKHYRTFQKIIIVKAIIKFKELVMHCDSKPNNILGYLHFSIICTPLPIH